jgi:hypothetical protein
VSADAPPGGAIPDAVRHVLDEFREELGITLTLSVCGQGDEGRLYPDGTS